MLKGLFHWIVVPWLLVVGSGCRCQSDPVSLPVAVEEPAQSEQSSFVEAYTAGAAPTDSLPMLVLIHGYGGNPENMMQSFSQVNLPARVIALRGRPTPRRGYYWFPVRVSDPDIGRLAKDLKTTAGDIAKQLDELSIRFPTKGKPVVVGFSQGAMIALELALWHPEVLGGGLVLSGYYPEQLYPTERSPESRPPLFSIHGTADEVLPIVHMRTIIAHANQLGYGIEHREYEGMAHGLDGQAHRQAMMLMERLLREQ